MRKDGTSGALNVVEWPHHGGEYENSGEGGMWALAIVEDKSNNPGFMNCCIDCLPELPPPDVCVTTHKYWPVKDKNKNSYERYNGHFLSVVFLGSSGGSWFCDTKGEYFQATYTSLTPDGKDLIDAMERIYGKGKVKILTFLDT